jgi:hypothetical protein
MPSWLLSALVKYAAPLVMMWLEKEGYFSAAQALLAKGVDWTTEEIAQLKGDLADKDPPAT